MLEQVARLSVRLTFQSVIEEIVCDELGRGRYERRDDTSQGYRNGWQPPCTLKTTFGPVEVQRPKLRHAHSALCDQLFGEGVTKTNALETLVISCWVRGVVGPGHRGHAGRGLRRGRQGVQGDRQQDLPATAGRVRRLEETRPSAGEDRLPLPRRELFQDAPARQGRAGAGCLGHRHRRPRGVLGPRPGATEPAEAWRGFRGDMAERGLRSPLLVVSDGGKGLCAAIETCLPDSLHQRCTVHVCRNLVEKVSRHDQDEVKRDYWAVFDGTESEGRAAEAEARKRAERFITKWEKLYPSAVACVKDNLDALWTALGLVEAPALGALT